MRLLQLALGADVTFYTKPSTLDSFYGKNPKSFQILLRVRPALSHHEPLAPEATLSPKGYLISRNLLYC